MNIGIVFTTKKSSGGAHQYSLNIIDALKTIPAYNYFIFNFSPDFPYEALKLGKNWHIVNLCSKEQKSLSGEIKKELNWKKLLLKFLDKLKLYKLKIILIEKNSKRKVKNFYKYNLDLIFYPLISEFSYLVEVPSIIAIHDLNHRLHPQFPELSCGGQYTIREHLYKRSIKAAKYILVDSEISKEDIINHYKVPDKKVIILPFVPPVGYLKKDISNEEAIRFLNKYNLPKRFIFYPAQFWPHKNHGNLVRALGILKRKNLVVPLVLVGSKREEWGEFDRVIKLIKENELEKSVFYLGYVEDREISILYRLAVALTMPVLMGPTYIPVIEAWYMGCPVLYSNIRGCREQAGDAALLFDPNSPEDIAEKIGLIWESDDLRNKLIEKGKERFNAWTEKDFNNRIRQIIDNFEKNNEK